MIKMCCYVLTKANNRCECHRILPQATQVIINGPCNGWWKHVTAG